MAQMLTERYRERLLGVLSCYDRIVIMGTLPGVCYAQGMTSFLYAPGIRIFDYARFAEPLRARIRARAEEACLADNAFVRIADMERAQALADALKPDELHRRLDHYAKRFCPVLDVFKQRYHWSLIQVEYSTDLIFRSQAALKPLYENLAREAPASSSASQPPE